MPEGEREEQTSANYAAAFGVGLLILYAGTASLWVVNTEPPQDGSVIASRE